MWIFTQYGFFSAVCARQGDGSKLQPVNPEIIQVRARVKTHLAKLISRFPDELAGQTIQTSVDTDYRYRIFVEKVKWARLLARLAEEIDYDNFKSRVAMRTGSQEWEYESALHEVWSVMLQLQPETGG